MIVIGGYAVGQIERERPRMEYVLTIAKDAGTKSYGEPKNLKHRKLLPTDREIDKKKFP